MRAVTERFNAGAAGQAFNAKNKSSLDEDEKFTGDIHHDEDAGRR